MSASGIPITLAISSYDHVNDLRHGQVAIEGTDPQFIELPIPEIFRQFREFDVSEMSSAKYVSLRSSGDDSVQAIPVFTSRLFRHSCIYVRTDKIKAPSDLVGARVGIPSWSMTAGVFARGLLSDSYGVRPQDIAWIQAGLDRPGRSEPIRLPSLPDGVSIVSNQKDTLEGMLWSGELDAVISPAVPESFDRSSQTGGAIGRLFPDWPRRSVSTTRRRASFRSCISSSFDGTSRRHIHGLPPTSTERSRSRSDASLPGSWTSRPAACRSPGLTTISRACDGSWGMTRGRTASSPIGSRWRHCSVTAGSRACWPATLRLTSSSCRSRRSSKALPDVAAGDQPGRAALASRMNRRRSAATFS